MAQGKGQHIIRLDRRGSLVGDLAVNPYLRPLQILPARVRLLKNRANHSHLSSRCTSVAGAVDLGISISGMG